MQYTERRAMTRLHGCVLVATAAVLVACGEPTSPGERSSFSADVRGSQNERLTGSATAGAGSAWARESVIQVSLPDVGTFSGIVLAADDLRTTISLIRSGTELPAGTHRIGRIPLASPPAAPIFTAGYVVRRADGLQLFTADSGSVTITPSGNRLTGSFTIYASRYDVIPQPTREMVGQPITPIASGSAPVTISGTFDAARR